MSDKYKKEKYILSAFIHGIRDRYVSKAVETMDPGDAEDALRLAKKAEIKMNKADILRLVEDKDPRMDIYAGGNCEKRMVYPK